MNLLLPHILLNILTLHKCKVGIHIKSFNQTSIGTQFMAEIASITDMAFIVQDSSLDMSYDTNGFGKACLTSFSEKALDTVKFEKRFKRAVKILLGAISEIEYSKTDYRPTVIEYPPIVSIMSIMTTASSSGNTNIQWSMLIPGDG